jgi:hypothetical protein
MIALSFKNILLNNPGYLRRHQMTIPITRTIAGNSAILEMRRKLAFSGVRMSRRV